jgi:hypothetical protein
VPTPLEVINTLELTVFSLINVAKQPFQWSKNNPASLLALPAARTILAA